MTSRDKRYAEWLASHVNKWGHPPGPGEAWDEAERQALERAAQQIEPKNEPDDWTEYAGVRAATAAEIRSLIEPTTKEPK